MDYSGGCGNLGLMKVWLYRPEHEVIIWHRECVLEQTGSLLRLSSRDLTDHGDFRYVCSYGIIK